MVFSGAKIAFFRGSVDSLLEDFALLKPTVLVSVPRLLAVVHRRVLDELASANRLTALTWDSAYAAKKEALKEGHYHNMVYDNTIFASVSRIFGGRVRLVIVGGAPIHPTLLEFFRVTIGPVYQG
jgi:long-chain acyl-CoA synthetase